MPAQTAMDLIRQQLRTLRVFVAGVKDSRLNDLDSLLSVAESEAQKRQAEIDAHAAQQHRH